MKVLPWEPMSERPTFVEHEGKTWHVYFFRYRSGARAAADLLDDDRFSVTTTIKSEPLEDSFARTLKEVERRVKKPEWENGADYEI